MLLNRDATITIRLTNYEKEELIKIAQQRDLTVSQLIRQAVRDFIQKQR